MPDSWLCFRYPTSELAPNKCEVRLHIPNSTTLEVPISEFVKNSSHRSFSKCVWKRLSILECVILSFGMVMLPSQTLEWFGWWNFKTLLAAEHWSLHVTQTKQLVRNEEHTVEKNSENPKSKKTAGEHEKMTGPSAACGQCDDRFLKCGNATV